MAQLIGKSKGRPVQGKHPQGREKKPSVRNPGGEKVFISPYTGAEFGTKAMMKVHCDAYRKRVLKDFETMVREKSLGLEPWERLPGEQPLEYNRFLVYLKMPKRNIRAAAKVMLYDERQCMRVCSRWHWRFRAELWDRHIQAAELAEFEEQKRASARQQARLGRKLQLTAFAGASALLANEDRVAEMSGNEIAKLADVGVKIERLANSDPTSISEDRGQIRLVWEGPAPSWAPQPDELAHGPLAQKVIEGER